MRVPLTKYGWPQVVIFPAIVLGAMIALVAHPSSLIPRLSVWVIISIEAVLAIVLIWVLSFFRDPYRICPKEANLLLSPADGVVTNIEIDEENNFIGTTALKIGIFLSIFDAHINRAPCNIKVERIQHKKGKYKNAMNPESGRVNESNDLYIIRTDSPKEKLIVRQISGAVARRIVCATKEGQELTGGEKFGMIKFGSRTELYVPFHRTPNGVTPDAENGVWEPKCLVKVGDRVKAGLTPLVRYQIRDSSDKATRDEKWPD